MRRKSFDTLASAAALVVAAVLLAAAGLLFWAHSFVSDNVRTQLAAEKVFFPPAGSKALSDPDIKPYLTKYAGQQLVTGDQAKAYADHFIAVHLKATTGGKTYSELSAQAQAAPNDTVLAAKVATAFKGETLRGLLLNAYAFGTMAKVAFVAFWIALGSGLLLLGLAALGLLHARRTSIDVELHVPGWHPESQPAV
ncbi:MAG: hypothetical protein JWN87_1070 [Frankiales bacterium]|jgi:hypothetical protein|nr:hypothetical protein [Frankiales bacterium]MCW2584866.1 hypothetical protein [Frankiales bacterium]